MGDSVPKHTGPISLTDTHPRTRASAEPDRPPPEKAAEMEKPVPQKCSSCLSMQLFGVETHSFLPHR